MAPMMKTLSQEFADRTGGERRCEVRPIGEILPELMARLGMESVTRTAGGLSPLAGADFGSANRTARP